MSEHDQTFGPKAVVGPSDLISWFSDFALFLDTRLVHEQSYFLFLACMTRPLIPKSLNWYMNILLSHYE